MTSYYLYEPFYDLDRLISDAFPTQQVQRRQEGGDNQVRTNRPRMDLYEDTQNNTVTATFELPGLTKDNVNIEIHNGRLSISGEVRDSSERDEHGYAVRERRTGKFFRTIQLPQGVKESDVKASMDNGVLTVAFPKTTPEMAPKKIAIN